MCYQHSVSQITKTLESKDLPELARSIFGSGQWHKLPLGDQLMLASKALRIAWVRSFSAYEQGHPTDLAPGLPKPVASLIPDAPRAAKLHARRPFHKDVMERGNKRVDLKAVWSHISHGKLQFWGDVEYDLDLFNEGHVKKSDLISVYGMKWEALEFLQRHSHSWYDEIEYLNAYAGLRHCVFGDQFFLMRTACQRASTAMDRILDAEAAGFVLRPGYEKLYALSGMRFQELYSALCANMDVQRANLRAAEKPLEASWWKSRTTVVNGKRVDLAYVAMP